MLATGVMNAANWLFHVVMSRTLGPQAYGGISALLGVLLLLTVPLNTVQMGFSAFVARAQVSTEEPFYRRALARSFNSFLGFGLVAFAMLAVVSSSLADVLKLPSRTSLLIMGTVLISWSVLTVLRGMLQGTRRVWALGASLASEALIKLGAATLLVALGFGLNGAVAGVSLGACGACALTLAAVRPWRQGGTAGRGDEMRGMLRSLLPYAAALGCFTVLTQADVVLVKALFPAYEAGIYAAASTGGKMILYVTAALPMVMLPEMVHRHAVNEDSTLTLRRGLIYGALTGGGVVVLYFLAPTMMIRVLFGGAYANAAPLLGLLGLAMLAYQLALLEAYYLLGTRQYGFLRSLAITAVAFPILLWTVRESMRGVALVIVVLGVITLVSLWRLVRRTTNP